MKVLVIFNLLLFSCNINQAEAAGIVAGLMRALPKIDPQTVGNFINGIKSLFGSGSEFSTKFGYQYGNVYSDQLKYQALNTFINEEQLGAELQQEETLEQELHQDKIFLIITVCLLISIAIGVIGTFVYKIVTTQHFYKNINKEKIVKEYKREVDINTILHA